MLKLALDAGIPLVSVTTDDPIYVHEVLDHAVTLDSFMEMDHRNLRNFENPNTHTQSKLWYMINPDDGVNWLEIYDRCNTEDIVFVLVNPLFDSEVVLPLGELVIEQELIVRHVSLFTTDKRAQLIARLFAGRSLKIVHWYCQLAIASHGVLNTDSVQDVLRHNQPSVRGLSQVRVGYDYYKPEPSVQRWLSLKGKVFKNASAPQKIWPRGILCYGTPGTGKTMSVKALAVKLDVNLYRIDINGLLDMYIGKSEQFLSEALEYVEQMQPCILLFDEVEKLFIRDDNSGVIDRLLSILLWWMNEHQAQVVTCMTTNNREILPMELSRKGRIDEQIEFRGLAKKSIPVFVKGVLNTFGENPILSPDDMLELIKEIQQLQSVNQADATDIIYNRIRILFTGDK